MKRCDLVSNNIPLGWNSTKLGNVKFITFVLKGTGTGNILYMLKEKRTEGKDYLFSIDKLFMSAIKIRREAKDKIIVENGLVYFSNGRQWLTADSNTIVKTIDANEKILFSGNVEGSGQTIKSQEVSGDLKNQEEEQSSNDANSGKEIFNVYVTNPMEDWNVSNFDKYGTPTAVKKLKFKRADGKDGVLHHNIHIDPRMGGQQKELFNKFDSALHKELTNLKPGQTIMAKNVTYGWWRFPGASAKRDWIFPTDNTEVKIITIGKPKSVEPVKKQTNTKRMVPKVTENYSLVNKIIKEANMGHS